mmetsp:Transcript_58146/g.138379  ORF Transcript_58146/g.138379 Transcript_58146/m.138379 type:complete len:1236 (+) Transcript_58146:117-3824(+)
MSTESSPLTLKAFPSPAKDSQGTSDVESSPARREVWDFLEANGPAGKLWEAFTITLILANVLAFIGGTLFNSDFNVDSSGKYQGPYCSWCDVMLFGNNDDNGLWGTSVLEIVSVTVFTVDYMLRLWAVVESPDYHFSRVEYVLSFFSLIDLLAILPFYVELLLPTANLPAAQFLRMFRLFRMMRVEGRYSEAFTLFDDVLVENAHLFITAGFVGVVTWFIAAGFYYAVERRSLQMVYCPTCPEVDVSNCVLDEWGAANCAPAGCNGECWNLFQSIPSSLYFTLLNLFGEYPLADRHSDWGKVVAVVVAVIAVFVFGIPTGIIGNGFDSLLKRRKQERLAAAVASGGSANYGATAPSQETQSGADHPDVVGDAGTFRSRIYNFLHGHTIMGAIFEQLIFALIVTSTLSFMLESLDWVVATSWLYNCLEWFELATVIIFTIEYLLRLYSIQEDPAYQSMAGFSTYLFSFFSLVDMASILPYWIILAATGSTTSSTFVRALRLLRLFKSERYIQAFTIFDDVLRAQCDLLLVTGFAALVLWVFFSAVMYYCERGNPDAEVASYYRTIPDAMWITMLNLSGESPLCFYTVAGKFVTAVIGLCAVSFIGIPIGILGAGFQDWVSEHHEDIPDAPSPAAAAPAPDVENSAGGQPLGGAGSPSSDWRAAVAKFIEAETPAGRIFEIAVFALIGVTVLATCLQTVEGLGCPANDQSGVCLLFAVLEVVATVIFTAEYGLRFYGSPSRVEYVFSFYSLIDLLAIVPTYIAWMFPGGWVDRNNTYFLLLRILRIIKLDKYVPSLTLIDDVFRLKRNQLVVTGVVASIVWLCFASMMYMVESQDFANEIDTLPNNGCMGNCTQAIRYSDVFSALPITMIHLTGDFPVIEYSHAGRIVCFFMVVAGVGLVSIPSGVIADGYMQVVQEKSGIGEADGEWEKAYAALGDTPPPQEFSSSLDSLQVSVNAMLNGEREGKQLKRSTVSILYQNMMFSLILANVAAVMVESIPSIDRAVGNAAFNIFDVFETFTVVLFTIDFILRLFSVTKDKEHLYSRWVYLTTFFGIVDMLTIFPFYVEVALRLGGVRTEGFSTVFRTLRLFRLFELEHFITAFTILDNVFRRSRPMLLATAVMAFAIWISSGALFYLFERNNPNFCEEWSNPACEAVVTADCQCLAQSAFTSIPDSLYWVAIFLVGEWAVIDFTFCGKLLCLFLCVVGIGIYALPLSTLFDSFGACLEGGLEALDEEED